MHLDVALLTHLLLGIAILFLFKPLKKPALAFALASLLSAFWFHQLGIVGILFIAGAGISLELSIRTQKQWVSICGLILFTCVALLSSVHLIPGVWNPLVFGPDRLSADSYPYKLYLNLDKPFMAFCLLYSLIPRSEMGWNRAVLRWSLMTLAILLALMMPVALAIHFVRLDFKLPAIWTVWMIDNLLFVCVAEESIFRGLIQGELTRKFPNSKFVSLFALFLGAILFGLSHYKGGLPYVGLAIVAGALYGTAYYKTRNLNSAILVHFLFNAIHFTCFSYPALDLTAK